MLRVGTHSLEYESDFYSKCRNIFKNDIGKALWRYHLMAHAFPRRSVGTRAARSSWTIMFLFFNTQQLKLKDQS